MFKSIFDHYIAEIGNKKKGKGSLARGERLFIAGLEMQSDKKFYPNANSTMRVTYGTVGDYVRRCHALRLCYDD